MALKKQYLKTKPEVRVTFEVSKIAAHNAAKIYLITTQPPLALAT